VYKRQDGYDRGRNQLQAGIACLFVHGHPLEDTKGKK